MSKIQAARPRFDFEKLGAEIKRRREALGWSRETLSARTLTESNPTPVSVPTIKKIESGDLSIIAWGAVRVLAALKIGEGRASAS